jgi:mannosyltransferase
MSTVRILAASHGVSKPSVERVSRTLRGNVKDVASLFLLTALTAGLGSYRAATTSLWADEAWSLRLAQQPLAVMWHWVWGNEANMALYYVVLDGWLRLASRLDLQTTELIVRVPSIVFAAGATSAVYLLGRLLASRTAANLASLLYLMNYAVLMQSAQARSYSLELLLTVLSWCALVAALRRDGRAAIPMWSAYVLASVLAVYAHLFAVLIIVSQIVTVTLFMIFDSVITEKRRWNSALSFASSQLAVGLLISPMALDVLIHGGANTWVQAASPDTVFRLVGTLVGANPLYLVLIGVGIGLAAYAVARRERAGLQDASSTAVALLGLWILIPIAASFTVTQSFLNVHLFTNRYLVVVVPPMCLLAAVGLGALRGVRIQAGLAILVLLASVPSVALYYARVQRQDFRSTAYWVENASSQDTAVACASWGCSVAMEYYLPDRFSGLAPGAFNWSAGKINDYNGSALEMLLATHRRVILIYDTIGTAPDAKSIQTQRWLDRHATLVRTHIATGSFGTVYAFLYESSS